MDDEEPDHDNSCPSSTSVGWPRVLERTRNTCDDDVTDCHTNGASDQDRFATKLVDVHDSGYGGDEHHDTHDSSGKERYGVRR